MTEASDSATTPYEQFGGHDFFAALVHAFYERVALDPILRPMYPPDDLAGAEDRLRMFLEQYWGGPTTYNELRGHPKLRMRHMAFPIDAVARDRWLTLMHDSMVEQRLPEALETQLWTYFVSAAFAMQNIVGDQPDELPVTDGLTMHDPRHWWRSGVVYQVYPRSFADSDGDGIGDIPGLIGRLDHLRDLGIDAIWISPFYTSPLHDGGYDVADYRSIDRRLGTMDDVEALLRESHARGIRVLMDIVPNHTSSEHPWFREALQAGPGSTAWDRFVIRKGRGKGGEEPPNNWRSVFHGDAWSPMPDAAGQPTGYWYLHLFDSTQPDLDWENEEVRAEFDDILRFWFDRGIDGFRIDVAHGLVKAAGLPDIAVGAGDDVPDDEPELLAGHRAPYWDQPGVHDIYRRWRRIADGYDPPRIFCGEAWTPSEESLARYLRSDELHTCFNFQYLAAGWDPAMMRTVIDRTIATHASVDAPPTWVLSNHDVIRHRTRMAPGFDAADPLASTPDLARGLMRARAATLFLLALPGSAYLYQGEELGLPEVLDLDAGARQDPAWHRSAGTDGFRDGCRVPIPWSGDAPSYGFGPASASWLPQPEAWAELSVEAQHADDEGTLAMYREALRIRRAELALGEGPMAWIDPMPDGVLAIRRTAPGGPSVLAVINTGDRAAMLPAELGTDVLMASGDGIAVVEDEDGTRLALAGETAVWLRG